MEEKMRVGNWILGIESMGGTRSWFGIDASSGGRAAYRGWRSKKQVAKAILTAHSLGLIKITDEEKALFNQILGEENGS